MIPLLKKQEKTRYIIKHTRYFKVLYLLSFVSWLCVLTGFYLVYRHNTIYLFTFGIAITLIAFSVILSSLINITYKKFSLSAHRLKVYRFWKKNSRLSNIDILLPICGEDMSIVKNTWEGVFELKKRYGRKIRVYVLDDKGQLDYKKLAKRFGFRYLSRQNKGQMKKAGNLKYGLRRSNGDFVIIFDADFRPHIDFIKELFPYMSDPLIGIVQSPQYFDSNKKMHDLSKLQFGAANIQEYFYKVIERSRGTFDGSICVGTNAIYRRDALNTIGGTAQIEHSEDVWTGFKLISKGWKLKYIPIILAKGICPSDMYSYFKQQNRWCLGSMSLLTSRTFWQSHVSVVTKMTFISGFLFYISNPLMMILPFQNFILLWDNHLDNSPLISLLFLPSLIVSSLMLYTHVYRGARWGTVVAYMAASWSYTYAILSIIFNIKEHWTPTGSKSRFNRGFKLFTLLTTSYLFVYWLVLISSVLSGRLVLGDIHYGLMSFWIGVNLAIHGMFIYSLWSYILVKTGIISNLIQSITKTMNNNVKIEWVKIS